jgi:hypothetical protein
VQILHSLTGQNTTNLIVPRLLLAQGALDMIATYVTSKPDSEINGFAYVCQQSADVFYVASATDVFITQQTVGTGSAHVSGTAYALAVDRAAQDDRIKELRLQWHSHPGDAYFSSTDMANVENFGAAGAEWFISLVTNREGDIHARFDMYRPVRFGAEMVVGVYRSANQALRDRAAADIATMVTTIKAPRVKSVLGVPAVQVTTTN